MGMFEGAWLTAWSRYPLHTWEVTPQSVLFARMLEMPLSDWCIGAWCISALVHFVLLVRCSGYPPDRSSELQAGHSEVTGKHTEHIALLF